MNLLNQTARRASRASRASCFAALAASLVFLFLAACGGGSSGGGGGSPPPTQPPTASITFTPNGAPGNSTIHLTSGAGSTANSLFLEVRANQVSGLYGVSLDISYPANLFNFVGATPGAFFTGGNGDPSVQVAESPDGNLIVGATLLGAQPGITGTGVIVTLQLQAVAGGTGTLTFSGQQGFNAAGNPILGLTWQGGTAQVVR